MQKNLYRFSRRSTSSKSVSHVTDSKATEEVASLSDRYDENKTYLSDFSTRLKKECRAWHSHIDDGKRVGECLVSFHQKLLQGDADPKLVDCLEKTRDFQLNLYDLQTRLVCRNES